MFLETDFFGERSLLTEIDLQEKSRKFNEKIDRIARLTVIVDCEETLLMKLELKSFLMLPNEFQSKLKNLLIDVLEFDQMDMGRLRSEMLNWKKFKKNISKKLVLKNKN